MCWRLSPPLSLYEPYIINATIIDNSTCLCSLLIIYLYTDVCCVLNSRRYILVRGFLDSCYHMVNATYHFASLEHICHYHLKDTFKKPPYFFLSYQKKVVPEKEVFPQFFFNFCSASDPSIPQCQNYRKQKKYTQRV